MFEIMQRLNRDLRTIAILAALALLAVVGVIAVIFGGESGGDDAGGETTTTTMATGGIAVAAPEGWRAIPMPQFGVGIAIPEDWEATVLSADVLADLESSSPVVPGFLDAAHAAAQAEAVFYAAGVDGEGAITDLKVRADLDTGVTDVAGLETYAADLAEQGGAVEPAITVVEATANLTVEVRYTVEVERPVEGGEEGQTERLTVQGTDRMVLGPDGVVYSLIVTSEAGAQDHDTVAAQIFNTLTFPPAA